MIPFVEYYMISSETYRQIRCSGSNQKREELAKENMEKFFPQISYEQYKKYLSGDPVFKEILQTVQNAFKQYYSFECTDIQVNNLCQETFNSYAYIDGYNPVIIHIDQLLESVIMSFMMVFFKCAKDMEKRENTDTYFKILCFIFNQQCIYGQMPDENAKEVIMKKVSKDPQILNLASDCYWSIILFTVAHEVAHVYQMEKNPGYWREHLIEAEYNADEIAYDILLKLIMEKKNQKMILEDYTYLAPMMYMDFFNLYYYTDYILYETKHNFKDHPTPEGRKERLFEIVDREIYQLDTENGNAVYQHFCQVYDFYMDKLLEYKVKGKLNMSIHKEARDRR